MAAFNSSFFKRARPSRFNRSSGRAWLMLALQRQRLTAAAALASQTLAAFSQAAASTSAATASGHATTTAADAVSTAADAVQTAADSRVQTGLDRQPLEPIEHRYQQTPHRWPLDRTAAANSAAAALTSQNAASASQTAAASSASSASTDAASTAADVVSTNADAVSTAADAVATAADRVQTGNDATAGAASATSASTSASAASTSATAASASQTAAAASAAAAAASYDSFDDRYLGPQSPAIAHSRQRRELAPDRSVAVRYDCGVDENLTGTAWINAGSAVNGTAERETAHGRHIQPEVTPVRPLSSQ